MEKHIRLKIEKLVELNNGGIFMVDMHMHTLYSDGDKTVEEV